MSVFHNRVFLAIAIATVFVLVAGCSQQAATPETAMHADSRVTAPSDDVAAHDGGSIDAKVTDSAATEKLPTEARAPVEPPPTHVIRDVAAGTQLEVELMDTLSSGTSQVGDPVLGRLASPLLADGSRIARAGAEVRGVVTEVVALKKFGGQPRISVMFESLTADDGSQIAMLASHTAAGNKQAGRDAAKIGGGAAAGALIGHQVDDDKGKEIGALIGGAIGTAVAAKTGKQVELTSGTTIFVVLEDNVRVRLAS